MILIIRGEVRITIFVLTVPMETLQIKPLIAPTRQIMKIGVKNYDWHELFPKGKPYLFPFHVQSNLIKIFLVFIYLT